VYVIDERQQINTDTRCNEKTLKIHSTLFSFHSSQVTFIKQNLGRPTCIYLVIIMYHTITIQCLYEMCLKSMYKERKGTISQI